MGLHLLGDGGRQTLFGQSGKRRIEGKGHNCAVNEDHKGEKQVKFLWGHVCFSEVFSQVVTGRSSKFVKIVCGTPFDACFFPLSFC